MAAEAQFTLPGLRVDGLAASNDFLCQFQADILGVTVERPSVLDTTALGAAYLAGLAVGFWRSLGDVGAHCTIERRFNPAMDERRRAVHYERWRQAVERAKGWAAPG